MKALLQDPLDTDQVVKLELTSLPDVIDIPMPRGAIYKQETTDTACVIKSERPLRGGKFTAVASDAREYTITVLERSSLHAGTWETNAIAKKNA